MKRAICGLWAGMAALTIVRQRAGDPMHKSAFTMSGRSITMTPTSWASPSPGFIMAPYRAANPGVGAHETDYELSYQAAVTMAITIQSDIQFVRHPSGRPDI